MQERTALWKELAASGSSRLETVAVIGENVYSSISEPVIRRSLMSNGLSVGNCFSSTMQVSIMTTDAIPQSARVMIRKRFSDETRNSEWLPAGTFFISRRATDLATGQIVTLTCYDALLKANAAYPVGNAESWPKTMADVILEAAAEIGVGVDSRTASYIRTGAAYEIPAPTGLKIKEVLGHIAGAHGGNFYITQNNELRFAPLLPGADAEDPLNVLTITERIETGPAVTISGVSVSDGTSVYTAGTQSGHVLTIPKNPYASQTIADDLLERLDGLTYAPYAISGAYYDPAAELGDRVVRGDNVLSVLCAETARLGLAYRGDISAPSQEEITDEYPYISRIEELRQDVQDAQRNVSELQDTAAEIQEDVEALEQSHAEIVTAVDSIATRVESAEGGLSTLTQTVDGFETRVANAEGGLSTITQTVDGIGMSITTVTQGGNVYARINLRIGPRNSYGYIKLQGNVQVSGQLSAEALYAGYGEVANLSVDQLSTSRRIVRYLAGDTSDDNYIKIYEQNLLWITATATGGTTQATNPDGAPLYWPVDVSGLSRGADGYPVTAQQERIFTTTTPTEYPVQVYNYEEAVKRSISFEPFDGVYAPVDRFGAGNQQGNNRAWILKTTEGFDIRYLTPDNREIGLRMGADGKMTADGLVYDADAIRAALGLGIDGVSDGGASEFDLTQINPDGSTSGLSVDENGYTDVSGLRKVTAIDFSELAEGVFSETLDGGILNRFSVERDAEGRISNIIDASGHETAVIWES